jgi:hypothetical protein
MPIFHQVASFGQLYPDYIVGGHKHVMLILAKKFFAILIKLMFP